MHRPRFAGLLTLALCSTACVDVEGRDDLEVDRATPGIDVADYLLLDCDAPSSANRLGSEVMYTIPYGMNGDRGRFVIMKSSDGSGFEEWAVDEDWFYIRLDTTWAYENPANPGEWCDTQCGENGPGNCVQRWAGDSGDWVYTVYHEPGNYERPARWLPRRLDLSFGQSTDYTTTMGIQAERYAGCGPCDTNFSSPSVDRTVRATLHAQWHGFDDVLQLTVLAGPGAGERYFYGRGRGWIGFNDRVADAAPVTGTATPSLVCGGFVAGSVCGVGEGEGGEMPEPPPPPPPPAGDPRPDVRVMSLTWTPDDPRPGDMVRLRAEVVNEGGGATPEVVGVGFRVDGVMEHGWWSVVAPMAAGETQVLTMDAAWVPVAPGSHDVSAHVDDIGRFEESDESDNILAAMLVVGADDAPPPPPPPPPPSGTGDGDCPCLDGTTPSGEEISNYCHYPVDADPDCTMLEPGGYCDPNGNGEFSDADWVRGWQEYQAACT